MKTTLRRPTPTWARIVIGAFSAAIAAYGAMVIITQHHVGRTRSGRIVESTGAVAVGMGLFFVGAALVMASLALPQRIRMLALVVGAFVMVGGIAAALLLSAGARA